MGELEDKLNSILSSPEEMEKIMGLARSLSGSMGAQEKNEEESAPPSGAGGSLPFGDIDPKMLKMMGRLMGQYNSGGVSDKAALLNALKPYLREERRSRVDEALKIAGMAKLAKIAFSEFSGGDSDL